MNFFINYFTSIWQNILFISTKKQILNWSKHTKFKTFELQRMIKKVDFIKDNGKIVDFDFGNADLNSPNAFSLIYWDMQDGFFTFSYYKTYPVQQKRTDFLVFLRAQLMGKQIKNIYSITKWYLKTFLRCIFCS